MNPRFLFHSSTAYLQCLPAPKNCSPEQSAPPLSTQQHTPGATRSASGKASRQSGGGWGLRRDCEGIAGLPQGSVKKIENEQQDLIT